MSLRDRILAARPGEDRMTWPGTEDVVVVRGLSGLDRARLIDRVSDKPGAEPMGRNERLQLQFALTVALGCYTETGERLFKDGDEQALAGEDIEVLSPVATRIMELSRIGEAEEIAEAKNS